MPKEKATILDAEYENKIYAEQDQDNKDTICIAVIPV